MQPQVGTEAWQRWVSPDYDYHCRTGRWPRKTWDPKEIPHERRPCLLNTLSHAPGNIYGYATKWLTVATDRLPVQIEPGAFSDFLKSGADCPAIVDHDWDRGILARRSDRTLYLAEDREGLYFSLKLPETDLGHHVRVWGSKFVFGASFDYKVREQCMSGSVRLFRQLDLREISILLLSEPAIEGARAWLAHAKRPARKSVVYL